MLLEGQIGEKQRRSKKKSRFVKSVAQWAGNNQCPNPVMMQNQKRSLEARIQDLDIRPNGEAQTQR